MRSALRDLDRQHGLRQAVYLDESFSPSRRLLAKKVGRAPSCWNTIWQHVLYLLLFVGILVAAVLLSGGAFVLGLR